MRFSVCSTCCGFDGTCLRLAQPAVYFVLVDVEEALPEIQEFERRLTTDWSSRVQELMYDSAAGNGSLLHLSGALSSADHASMIEQYCQDQAHQREQDGMQQAEWFSTEHAEATQQQQGQLDDQQAVAGTSAQHGTQQTTEPASRQLQHNHEDEQFEIGAPRYPQHTRQEEEPGSTVEAQGDQSSAQQQTVEQHTHQAADVAHQHEQASIQHHTLGVQEAHPRHSQQQQQQGVAADFSGPVAGKDEVLNMHNPAAAARDIQVAPQECILQGVTDSGLSASDTVVDAINGGSTDLASRNQLAPAPFAHQHMNHLYDQNGHEPAAAEAVPAQNDHVMGTFGAVAGPGQCEDPASMPPTAFACHPGDTLSSGVCSSHVNGMNTVDVDGVGQSGTEWGVLLSQLRVLSSEQLVPHLDAQQDTTACLRSYQGLNFASRFATAGFGDLGYASSYGYGNGCTIGDTSSVPTSSLDCLLPATCQGLPQGAAGAADDSVAEQPAGDAAYVSGHDASNMAVGDVSLQLNTGVSGVEAVSAGQPARNQEHVKACKLCVSERRLQHDGISSEDTGQVAHDGDTPVCYQPPGECNGVDKASNASSRCADDGQLQAEDVALHSDEGSGGPAVTENGGKLQVALSSTDLEAATCALNKFLTDSGMQPLLDGRSRHGVEVAPAQVVQFLPGCGLTVSLELLMPAAHQH